LCCSVDSAVMLTAQSILRHNQPCGTVNTLAGSTSWQSTGRHNQHSVGTINPSAPSLVWPSQPSGTITSPAQSSFQHSPTSERARPGQLVPQCRLCRNVDRPVQSILQHNQPCGTVNTPAGSTSRQSTGRHNQHSVGIINPSAPSLVWPSQHSGTGNIAAEPTLRHNHHFGTITILAQHCGRVSPPAQSTVRHIHHSGTVNIPAQSTIQHHHHCGTRCWKHPDTPLHNSMIDAVNYG